MLHAFRLIGWINIQQQINDSDWMSALGKIRSFEKVSIFGKSQL